MAKSGRKRRYREARALKHGFDDGLFAEGDGTLADTDRGDLDGPSDPDAEGESDVYPSDGQLGERASR